MSKLLEKIEFSILALSLAVMCIVAFVNVISRYFLSHSLAFTEEITINLFVVVTFMGAAVGIHRKGHLGFNLLFENAGRKMQMVLLLFIGLITSFVFVSLTYYGVDMVLFQKQLNQMTPALGWPQWIFSLGLPLGSLFCLVRTLQVTWQEAKMLAKEGGAVS
ncbi:TRAP transporter small permease [Ammoniphilus sp. YIM 78166]|uniref:TRAP transporter small permease n=1 Tax=Ammoniphilus sp. YIM 78166 TaxID=1644106 RepID=UPI001F10A3EA|nr:TRAP transporter small permease [Ammoniphilus sp. YIM 78166]